MRSPKAVLGGGLILLAAAQSNAGSVDQKLLDMLLANGSITKAQHAELSTDLAREQRAAKRAAKETVSKEDFTEFQQLAGWAGRTALAGDMRVRQETVDVQDDPDYGRGNRDRQRVRARLSAISQVNPEVEAGLQIATGNSNDQRSTNQDLNTNFTKKSVWFDQAYINYHPVAVPGLKAFAGKFKQPWMSFGDIVWDSDINPEGFAAQYTKKMGTNTLFGSAGYYTIWDGVNQEGYEYSDDLGMYQVQLGAAFDAGDSARLTLGGSLYDFNDEKYATIYKTNFSTNGNTTDKFGIWEVFAQLDVIGLPLPLSIYGQYEQNYESEDYLSATDGDQDTGYLIGLRTNLWGVSVDYNYRDVESNAVVGAFTDSDFAAGYTNSWGHKLKLKYDILKNFSIGATYYMAESDAASFYKYEDTDVDTLQLDLEAKF